MSLSREFSEMVQDQSSSYRFIHPLMSGLEFLPLEKNQSRWMQEFIALQEMAKKHHWKNLPEVREPLHNPAVAIIVTNAREQIQWVNDGFFHMTGFTMEEALNRRPNFLQGPDTDAETTIRVRQSLKNRQQAKETLINYRKSGESYMCKVVITPLFNQEDVLTNFIAVEEEVIAS